jgi:hypothetical protein
MHNRQGQQQSSTGRRKIALQMTAHAQLGDGFAAVRGTIAKAFGLDAATRYTRQLPLLMSLLSGFCDCPAKP